jgi:hypothetical protein
MVRAHTRENPSYFIQRWRHLYGSLPKGLYIVKNEPLAQVLAKTDVALMFRSTVMLNCLFNRIPIIMPGWIDFDWRKVLDDIPGIYMADDFPDIENCLEEWLGQPPSISDEVVNNFVHPPGAGGDIFCAHVKDLMNRARLTQGLS